MKKRIERTETVAGGTDAETVVYSIGTLHGEWPDGTPFEGNRYVDRYVVRDGADRRHGGLERQRRVAAGPRRPGHAGAGAGMSGTYLGALPAHGRFDYRPITRPARLRLAERRPAGGLPRLQPRALRLRRRPGRQHRPGVAAARRAELRLARIRQPGRRLALPRTVRQLGAAGRHARSTPRSTTTAPNWSRPASRAATSSSAMATPTPNARAAWARPTKRALLRALPRPHAAASGARRTGWLSPWISESRCTPDLLAEAGYRYTPQLVPRRPAGAPCARAAASTLWSVPYPQELNDIPMIVAPADGRQGLRRR